MQELVDVRVHAAAVSAVMITVVIYACLLFFVLVSNDCLHDTVLVTIDTAKQQTESEKRCINPYSAITKLCVAACF